MASKVSPHSTRARKVSAKAGVSAPVSPRNNNVIQGLTKEDIASVVENAMESAMKKVNDSLQDAVKKTVDRMASTIGQQLSADLHSALRNINDDLQQLAQRVKDCEDRLNDVSSDRSAMPVPSAASVALQHQAFNIDKLDQLGKRENVRIRGIPSEDGEDTSQLVINLAKECGVEMAKNDISSSHRLQVENNTAAPILVRLVRKEKRWS